MIARRCGLPLILFCVFAAGLGAIEDKEAKFIGSRGNYWAFQKPVRPQPPRHLLGLDQNRLWFLHNGRNEKLLDFGGNVIQEMLA